MTEGPIGKNLLLFALPIMAGNIAQSLNGSVNAIWIGRYLGEEAMTAAANANSIMFFLIGSVFGIGMASTILIGQAMGARDIAQARKVMGTSASFFGGLSAVIAVLGWYLAPHLLSAMGTPGRLANAGRRLSAGDLPGDADAVSFRLPVGCIAWHRRRTHTVPFLVAVGAAGYRLQPVAAVWASARFRHWALPVRPGPH